MEIIVFTIFYNFGALPNTSALSLPQLITIIWLKQGIFPLNNILIEPELRRKIISGDVALDLCRPLDFYNHWFIRSTAGRISRAWGRAFFIVITAMVLSPLVPSLRLGPPASLASFAFFCVSLFISFFFTSAFVMFSTALRLRVSWGDGPTYILELAAMILGGTYLPLQLWPDMMQRLLLLQPFAGHLDIAMRLYVGSMEYSAAWPALLLQLGWTLFFVYVGRWVLARNLNSIIVQGG